MLEFTERIPDKKYKVLVADMHLHHLPTWRLDWCHAFVDSLIRLSHDLVDSDLVIMGDAFELRDRVDARVANLLIRLLVNWSGDTFWIVGQHDSFIPGRATFTELSGVGGITVIDSEVYREPGTNNYYVPFYRDKAEYLSALEEIPDGSVVFTHMPVAEALFGKGTASEGHISAKEFSRFLRVWSGDIHIANTYGKVSYVGAPGQLDWRDEGVQGRILLLDDDLNEYPVMVQHPKHVKLNSVARMRTFGCDDSGTEFLLKIVDIQPGAHALARLKELPCVISVEVDVQSAVASMETDVIVDNQPLEELVVKYIQDRGEFSEDLYKLALETGIDILEEAIK